MITFDEYQLHLEQLSSAGVRGRTIDSLLDAGPKSGALYIKHDVEARMDRALRTAQVEAECDHRATFYLQGDLLLNSKNAKMVRDIADMGHEIAYHYDVLDACDGDFDRAIEEFDYYLELIQSASGQPVRTVCPHGNPTKIRAGWKSNKDFFRVKHIRDRYAGMIDIVTDFPKLFPEGRYVSDAGFKLRVIGEIATNDSSNEAAMADGEEIGWQEIGSMSSASKGFVLSAHPHRFQDSGAGLRMQQAVFGVLKKGYQLTKGIPFVKAMASRLYTFTRRF